VEARIDSWVFRTLSRGGILVLLNLVLEGIQVYQNSIAAIPKGILDKIKNLSSHFLWANKNATRGLHLVKWSLIDSPKASGGWGIKDICLFARALAGRNLWRLAVGN
jgi:hypothetical protein